MGKPNKQPSSTDENRRHKPFILPESRPDHLTPAERLAEHKASKAHIGPDPGGTVRVTLRGKMGGEKGSEGPLVRSMYDVANSKSKRRNRRRKEVFSRVAQPQPRARVRESELRFVKIGQGSPCANPSP